MPFLASSLGTHKRFFEFKANANPYDTSNLFVETLLDRNYVSTVCVLNYSCPCTATTHYYNKQKFMSSNAEKSITTV